MKPEYSESSIADGSVRAAFAAFPSAHRMCALGLRARILDVAETLDELGGLVETLKWGEPAYLPVKARVGSTVRIACPDAKHVGLMFNCNTMLVEHFRCRFGDTLRFTKNRGVLFPIDKPLPDAEIRYCVVAALHYHSDRKRKAATSR